MAKKLEKKTTLKSLEEVNIELANLKVVSAKLLRIKSELNLKRTELENKYTPEIAQFEQQKLLIESNIELWAEDNKDDLTDKRSWDLQHGSLGYRRSTKTETIKGRKWDDVLSKIKEIGGKFLTYIRAKEEVAKDELRAAMADGSLTLDEAKQIYVTEKMIDNFFIEPSAVEVNN